jgi:hypothetical protein
MALLTESQHHFLREQLHIPATPRATGGAPDVPGHGVGPLGTVAGISGRKPGLLNPPDQNAAISPPVIGSAQQQRADALKAKLSPADQKTFQRLVDSAGSPTAGQYLLKGLAAGHGVEALEAFAAKIAGKNDTWLQDNLHLTGNSQGKGVKQQWSMSCNATTVEAVRGELDPLYALQLHEENPHLTERDDDDGGRLNPKLAGDQKALLETRGPDGNAGVAASVNDPNDPHAGRWNTDLLNQASASTGLQYRRQLLDDQTTVRKAVADIAEDVGKGMPVPIVIGDGNQAKYAHYVLVVATDPGPPRRFSIHDPANGTTEIRTEQEISDGKIGLAGDPAVKGSGWNTLSAYERPTAVPVK